ncbi:MAG: hypothetical protein JOZ81_14235 [Chloroflexi bacterium]|nr:hypothetical protein [Chloroflexota bacterium]
MALLEGLVDRLFAPPTQHVSEFYPRHLKLIELMWTANGRGRETYDALALSKVSYLQFVPRATQVVVVGLQEGWIKAEIPIAPTDSDESYEIHFVDPERWAEALLEAFSTALPDGPQQEDHQQDDPQQALDRHNADQQALDRQHGDQRALDRLNRDQQALDRQDSNQQNRQLQRGEPQASDRGNQQNR